jgi:predicted  nucleic acid-binding Zn-ribbon protein
MADELSYPERLLAIGLAIVGEYVGAKQHYLLECKLCQHQWTATPLSKLQAYKKYAFNGCPECHQRRRRASLNVLRAEAKQKLVAKGFELIGDWTGEQNSAVQVEVRNVNCGHTFVSSSCNLLHGNLVCPVCNLELKQKRCKDNNRKVRKKYFETADDWDIYRHTVYSLTREQYKEFQHIINPNDLPRGLAGTFGTYQLDHIVPVRWCFEHNIPEDVCADSSNLQMLTWEDNLQHKHKLKEGMPIPRLFVAMRDVLNIEELFEQ